MTVLDPAARPQAMVATADLHSADEAAKRIMPAVAPLAVDPVADVRAHALAALSRYSEVLKEEHRRLEAAAAAAAGQGGGALPEGAHLGHMSGAYEGLAGSVTIEKKWPVLSEGK